MAHAPARHALGEGVHDAKHSVSQRARTQVALFAPARIGTIAPRARGPARESADFGRGPGHGASSPANTSGKLCRATARSSTRSAS